MRPIFHISVSDMLINGGNRGMRKYGKVKNSLSKPRGGKILNYIKL